MNNRYYVYRFKDKDDNILYVGRTHNLKQRFRNHEHLTDNIITIEYIECSTETEMAIKEIYYINLYYNNDSTNIRDVYAKPNDLGFKDKWIKYNNAVVYKENINKDNKNKKEIYDNKKISDYEKIYVVKINWYLEYGTSTLYYTGGYDKKGLPNMSENPIEAHRFSSLDNFKRLKIKFKKIFYTLYPNLKDYEYDIEPGIYREDEISNYLFEYYHSDDNKRTKELFIEDQYLDILQGVCVNNLIYTNNHKFSEISKILKSANNLKISSIIEYQTKLRGELKEIETKRINLRKEPEWEDPIWNEEFAKPYIKNNYDPDKALEELFENRKNGNKNFTFELHKCFLPEGYTDIN